jgi:competence protein ComEC
VLHKEIPFIRLLVPLCAGILIGYLTDLPVSGALYLLGFAIIILAISLFVPTLLTNHLYGVALSLLLVTAGFSLLKLELARAELISNTEAVFICRIKTFPEPKPKSYAITVDIIGRLDDEGIVQEIRGGLLIYHSTADSSAPAMVPGDIMVIRTSPVPITNRGNPYEFDYRTFMLKKGIRYYAFTREKSILHYKSGTKLTIREKAIIAGKKISDIYIRAGIREDNAALLAGLTLGQKDSIDEETRTAFSRAGVMHVMAVSGLHAGVISMFVFSVLFFLRGKLLVLRVIVSVGVLWCFAFITGLSPSVERAALMFTFLHTGKLLKRPVNNINSILSVAFFMLVFNPSDLTSLGFQLSFSAVLFISGFYSRVSKLFRSGIWPVDRIWQMSVVSVLAQLGTLPFIMNAFGQFPAWFLPANLIIIPLATVIMILAFMLILLTPLGLFTGLLAPVLNFLLEATSHSARIISNLPGSADFGRVLLWPETIILILIIWAFLYYLFFMRYKTIKLTIAAIFLLVSISLFRYITTATSTEIIVYNSTNSITLGVRSGHNLWVYSEKEHVDEAVTRHISASGLKVIPKLSVSLPATVEFRQYKIVLADYYSDDIILKENPDVLITKKVPAIFNPPVTENKLNILVTSGSSNVIILTNDDVTNDQDNICFIPDDGAQIINRTLFRKKGVEIID